MIDTLLSVWRSKELRKKIFFIVSILVFIRFVAHIPLPQIDRSQLESFLAQSENQIFNVLGMFTGGSLSNLSIDLMGVGPYITASIVVQLLTKVIPAWENISKEGTQGREKLNQYTRYLTVPMAFIQGYGTISLLKSQQVLPFLTTLELAQILITITATSLFVMWLGELISEKGLGNGISMIIALGIIAGLPQQIANAASVVEGGDYTSLFILLAIFLGSIVLIVFMNEAERRIPITYARRAIGAGSKVDSYLPLKVNSAGVIPIIFALSFLTFPAIIARFLSTNSNERIQNISQAVTDFVNNQTYYGILYAVLVILFAFFYTFIIFQPEQISDNLQKQGSFVPGVRPGSETTKFIKQTLLRLTTIGSVFLAIIVVVPFAVEQQANLQTLALGGTSILIIVSVIIETSRSINAQLIMRKYDTL